MDKCLEEGINKSFKDLTGLIGQEVNVGLVNKLKESQTKFTNLLIYFDKQKPGMSESECDAYSFKFKLLEHSYQETLKYFKEKLSNNKNYELI